MLALKNVTMAYGKNTVLSGASLELHPKDCVCVIGAGGGGKSTLLRLLARIEDPTSGTVEVDGIDVKSVPIPILQLYRRRLGLIFQEPMLLRHATVRENIALPLDLFGAPQSAIDRMTEDLMNRLGLTAKADVLAEELSLSERSLVGIARAVIASPMIIIADEPLQHLDETQAGVVTELLLAMHKKGTTLLILSRLPETAKAFGARATHLKDGVITKVARTRNAAHPATYRILEEEAEDVREPPPPAAEAAPAPARKRPPQKDGKKIRITSIGSNLS